MEGEGDLDLKYAWTRQAPSRDRNG